MITLVFAVSSERPGACLNSFAHLSTCSAHNSLFFFVNRTSLQNTFYVKVEINFKHSVADLRSNVTKMIHNAKEKRSRKQKLLFFCFIILYSTEIVFVKSQTSKSVFMQY